VPSIAWLAVSPIRGTALAPRDEIRLEIWGVADNRRFYLVDDDGRRYTLTRAGELAAVAAEYDPDRERLGVRFPDGDVVEGTVELGEPVATEFFGPRTVTGRIVGGPWAEAFSALAGRRLRLVKLDRPGQAHVPETTASLVSRASLDELASRAGEAVDPRRFRMLVGIDGVAAHEEDDWIGRQVRVGDALLEPTDALARCAIPNRHPETGEIDLDTLGLIKSYRGVRDGDIDFGIVARVRESGRVRVGDAVEPL
jgi:uncharacterized protein YcbX